MRHAVPFLIILFLPSLGQACTVCFGDPTSGMAKGFYWGVMLLLLLPFTMAASLIGYIVYHSRRQRSK